MNKSNLSFFSEVVCLFQSCRWKKSLWSGLLLCDAICVSRTLIELKRLEKMALSNSPPQQWHILFAEKEHHCGNMGLSCKYRCFFESIGQSAVLTGPDTSLTKYFKSWKVIWKKVQSPIIYCFLTSVHFEALSRKQHNYLRWYLCWLWWVLGYRGRKYLRLNNDWF